MWFCEAGTADSAARSSNVNVSRMDSVLGGDDGRRHASTTSQFAGIFHTVGGWKLSRVYKSGFIVSAGKRPLLNIGLPLVSTGGPQHLCSRATVGDS